MRNISLKTATSKDRSTVTDIDYNLDKDEHIKLNREEKIRTALLNNECFLISADQQIAGFVLFDYLFFDRGWIELIVITEEYRGKGIAGEVFNLLCEQCTADRVFTSTNSSNIQMQRALARAGFSFEGDQKSHGRARLPFQLN